MRGRIYEKDKKTNYGDYHISLIVIAGICLPIFASDEYEVLTEKPTDDSSDGIINFTGGTDATNSELIDWLWANGTMYGIKQQPLVSKIINYIDIGTTESISNVPIIPGHNYTTGTLTYHTVAFNNNGHGTAPESQMVREGYKASQPSDLSEDGWIFNGWFSDKNCTNEFDFNSEIEESKTLYAGWETAKINFGYSISGLTVGSGEEYKNSSSVEEGTTWREWIENEKPANFEINTRGDVLYYGLQSMDVHDADDIITNQHYQFTEVPAKDPPPIF